LWRQIQFFNLSGKKRQAILLFGKRNRTLRHFCSANIAEKWLSVMQKLAIACPDIK